MYTNISKLLTKPALYTTNRNQEQQWKLKQWVWKSLNILSFWSHWNDTVSLNKKYYLEFRFYTPFTELKQMNAQTEETTTVTTTLTVEPDIEIVKKWLKNITAQHVRLQDTTIKFKYFSKLVWMDEHIIQLSF